MRTLLLSLRALGFALTVSGANTVVDYKAYVSHWSKGLYVPHLMFGDQDNAVSQQNRYRKQVRLDSSQGYWKVYTDYNTRVNRVSFYSGQAELLYQEKIKDRYVKLTKRTIRQFVYRPTTCYSVANGIINTCLPIIS